MKKNLRLMFQDKAGFGRINKLKRCWSRKGVRPSVPCHRVREYSYAYDLPVVKRRKNCDS